MSFDPTSCSFAPKDLRFCRSKAPACLHFHVNMGKFFWLSSECMISVGCSALCSGVARAPYCQVGDVWRQSGSGNGAGALVTPQKVVVVTMGS